MSADSAICIPAVRSASLPPDPWLNSTAGKGPGPSGFQRYALRQTFPLGNSTVCGTIDRLVSHKAESESSRKHANQCWILTALRPPSAQIYRSHKERQSQNSAEKLCW